jgi:hypothetical protein
VRHGAGNSINLIRCGDSEREPLSCTVERWDYQHRTQHFMPVNVIALDLDRGVAQNTADKFSNE